MGDAKRKRAFRAMMQSIVDSCWDMLSVPKSQGAPLDRVDLLTLLFEKALLLKGLSEAEQDKLLELMEEIDRRATKAGMLKPDDEAEPDNWRQVADALPENLKPPIDPDRMRNIEERGQIIAQFVGNAAKGLGWVVIVFETGNRPELTYLSNCAREDIVKLLDEFKGVLRQRRDFPPGVLSRRPN